MNVSLKYRITFEIDFKIRYDSHCPMYKNLIGLEMLHKNKITFILKAKLQYRKKYIFSITQNICNTKNLQYKKNCKTKKEN